jgi:hypothetical protein
MKKPEIRPALPEEIFSSQSGFQEYSQNLHQIRVKVKFSITYLTTEEIVGTRKKEGGMAGGREGDGDKKVFLIAFWI